MTVSSITDTTRRAFAVLIGAIAIVACSQGAPLPSQTGVSEASPSQIRASEAPDDSDGGSPSSSDLPKITISHASQGISSVPTAAAADDLRSLGYEVETVILDASELSIEGISNGDFTFGAGGNSTGLTAMAGGGNLKFIVDQTANEWSLYARMEVAECAELDGKRVGIFSEGGVSTAMVRNYFATTCPDAGPEYLVLGDSQTRAAALVAGEIDATPVELSDALNLEATAPAVVHRLASFAEGLPNLTTTSLMGNATFIEANPDATKDFIRTLLEQHRRIQDDPEYLKEITLEHYPEVNMESLDATVDAYVEQELFSVNGGLTEENLIYTIDFFVEAGSIEPGLTVEDVSDLSYLDAVLEEIGRE